LSSILPGHTFSSVVRNNSHLPCCLLSTHMARARSRDSHAGAGGVMLDYSIRGHLTLLYHMCFMVGLAEESPLALTGLTNSSFELDS
jgi:hypothetical protein